MPEKAIEEMRRRPVDPTAVNGPDSGSWISLVSVSFYERGDKSRSIMRATQRRFPMISSAATSFRRAPENVAPPWKDGTVSTISPR